MTTHRRNALLVALSAATVATALLPLAPASAAAPAAPAAPALDWTACGPAGQGQECAKLTVPLDYRDPDGEQLALAVTRIRSTRPEARRGTLMVIPGGPGGSGVERLTQKGARLAKETGGAYDLVAFDPRGVGGSSRANCRLDEADRWMVTLRSWPAADGGIDANAERSRRTAEACRRNGGAVLDSFTTANQVRDMDRLRRALGEQRLSAWSTSYGAYVAAQYAQKFPRRTDRIVLDSSADPDPKRVAQGWLRDMAKGAEVRFPDFAAWAAHPERDDDGLRLAARSEDVRPLFLALAARLDREPVPSTTAGVAVDGNVLRQAMQLALGSDGAFPSLARLIKAVQDPAAATDPTRRPVLPPPLAQPLSDEDAAIMVGVICNDVRWTGTVGDHRTAVAADRTAHPLTAGFPVNITPCSFWKAPAEKPTRLTSDGPSNILMIQSRRDPNAPHSSGLKMRAALGDRARLVTVERGGHGMYLGNGNACGDAAVTRFLLTGERPEQDVYCAN
ncbi:alpha/beta hydrolase [Streptomyces sp. NPDC048604]|uniref:alpha/beta hydrolase n=1 Tax=Streptomyces sp. NPDC048604 TaxID=3365578 RepID=UPI003711CC52